MPREVLAAASIPEEDAQALCSMAKKGSPAAWRQGAKEGALTTVFGLVCEPPRPGLIVEIYINRGPKVKRRTLNFGLWDSSAGWERVYQLTIADSGTPTYTEISVVWYGSHEHIGHKAVGLTSLDTLPFADALKGS